MCFYNKIFWLLSNLILDLINEEIVNTDIFIDLLLSKRSMDIFDKKNRPFHPNSTLELSRPSSCSVYLRLLPQVVRCHANPETPRVRVLLAVFRVSTIFVFPERVNNGSCVVFVSFVRFQRMRGRRSETVVQVFINHYYVFFSYRSLVCRYR